MRHGIFALLFCLIATPAFAVNDSITIVADEWCPYNCAQKDEKPGYMIEIVRAAFARYNIDVVYKVMPWAKAIEDTRAGKYQAVVGANRGDAPDFIFPEVVQGISINQAWVKKDSNWEYRGVKSLDGKRLGIVEGYSYGKDIDPYLKARKEGVQTVSRDDATAFNINELLAGRIDVLLEDKNVVEYYFASRGLPMQVKAVGNPVDINNYDDTYIFVAFGPNDRKSKAYAVLLTQGMKEMRQTGELKVILERYNMDDSYRFLGKMKAN